MSDDIAFGPLHRPQGSPADQAPASIDPRLSRTHYFDGRLLTAADLVRDQQYLDGRLREVGRVLGSGIAQGLETTLDERGRLKVGPGIAVAPSGRVLELDQALDVDLLDAGLIASLNDTPAGRLRRGLYAVTLHYFEVGSDSAEAYPQDLETQRGLHFNSWTEGAELTLTPLRTAPPALRSDRPGISDPLSHLSSRAALVRTFLPVRGQPPELGEEAVALGLLAVDQGRPLWLDLGLLRRPLRPPGAPHTLQEDLHRHYEELLGAVLAARSAGALPLRFGAAQHFRLLPPFGHLPQQAVDPEHGQQAYFPDRFQVSVAPVRRAELGALLEESGALDPLDLEAGDTAQIMILAPMSDVEFELRARQLEHGTGQPLPDGHGLLPHIDPLTLRLFPLPAAHTIDTDAAVWREIWAQTDEVLYLRRPPRAAETGVSAVVLARGYALPSPATDSATELRAQLATTRAALAQCRQSLTGAEQRVAELEAAAAAGLHLGLRDLAELRGLGPDLGDTVKALEEQLQGRPEAVKTVARILLQVPSLYDRALWPSLVIVARKGLLDEFARFTRDKATPTTLGRAMVEGGAEFGLSRALIEQWRGLDPAAPVRPPIRDTVTVSPRGLQPRVTTVQIKTLLQRRQVTDPATLKAATRLAEQIGTDRTALGQVNRIAALVDIRYDRALWPTLLRLAERGTLADFLAFLSEVRASGQPLGMAVAAHGDRFGLTDAQRRAWRALD